ncbi:unnamed protein product [Amoebophrya sp. A120]|nr:unnamed protein product [Amoebophrya sp. A120]|eukprot:GSA120T00021314001.1
MQIRLSLRRLPSLVALMQGFVLGFLLVLWSRSGCCLLVAAKQHATGLQRATSLVVHDGNAGSHADGPKTSLNLVDADDVVDELPQHATLHIPDEFSESAAAPDQEAENQGNALLQRQEELRKQEKTLESRNDITSGSALASGLPYRESAHAMTNHEAFIAEHLSLVPLVGLPASLMGTIMLTGGSPIIASIVGSYVWLHALATLFKARKHYAERIAQVIEGTGRALECESRHRQGQGIVKRLLFAGQDSTCLRHLDRVPHPVLRRHLYLTLLPLGDFATLDTLYNSDDDKEHPNTYTPSDVHENVVKNAHDSDSDIDDLTASYRPFGPLTEYLANKTLAGEDLQSAEEFLGLPADLSRQRARTGSDVLLVGQDGDPRNPVAVCVNFKLNRNAAYRTWELDCEILPLAPKETYKSWPVPYAKDVGQIFRVRLQRRWHANEMLARTVRSGWRDYYSTFIPAVEVPAGGLLGATKSLHFDTTGGVRFPVLTWSRRTTAAMPAFGKFFASRAGHHEHTRMAENENEYRHSCHGSPLHYSKWYVNTWSNRHGELRYGTHDKEKDAVAYAENGFYEADFLPEPDTSKSKCGRLEGGQCRIWSCFAVRKPEALLTQEDVVPLLLTNAERAAWVQQARKDGKTDRAGPAEHHPIPKYSVEKKEEIVKQKTKEAAVAEQPTAAAFPAPAGESAAEAPASMTPTQHARTTSSTRAGESSADVTPAGETAGAVVMPTGDTSTLMTDAGVAATASSAESGDAKKQNTSAAGGDTTQEEVASADAGTTHEVAASGKTVPKNAS